MTVEREANVDRASSLSLSNHLAADSAADEAGSTARSTRPLCDSSQCPSLNGADADASMGIPTLADRTAATTQPL